MAAAAAVMAEETAGRVAAGEGAVEREAMQEGGAVEAMAAEETVAAAGSQLVGQEEVEAEATKVVEGVDWADQPQCQTAAAARSCSPRRRSGARRSQEMGSPAQPR